MASIIQGVFSFFFRARGWKCVPLTSQLYVGNALSGSLFGKGCMPWNETHPLFVCVCVCAWNIAVAAPDGTLPLKTGSTALRQKQVSKTKKRPDFSAAQCAPNSPLWWMWHRRKVSALQGRWMTHTRLCLVSTSHKRGWTTSRSCKCKTALQQVPHISEPTKTPSPT